MATSGPLAYYAFPGMMTDPGEHSALLMGLPAEIPALAKIGQKNLLHIFWAERYGQVLDEARKAEVGIRRASTMLGCIKAKDDRLLTVSRPPDKRLIGNCRDFTVMMCTLLRHQGIPARARCGFGTYFLPDHYEDHWVAEYWNAEEQRWVLVDAQLDDFQVAILGVRFDPCDVPRDQFVTGGAAWQMARSGKADPDSFGIFDMHGLWFIRGNLIRDMAAFSKMELLPWDWWGLMLAEDAQSEGNLAFLDHVAELALAGNEAFAEIRALYEDDPRLRVPPIITSFPAGPEPQTVDIMQNEVFPEPVG